MPKLNPYLIENKVKVEEVRYLDEQKLPKISFAYSQLPQGANVSYFIPEKAGYLNLEEWKQLHPEVIPNEIIIINQDGTYQSWKAGVDYPPYGPGIWDDFILPVGKFVGKVTVAAGTATLIVTSAGTLAPIVAPVAGAVLYAGGSALKDSLEDAPDGKIRDFLRGGCDVIKDAGVGTAAGGLGSAIGQMSSNSLRIARETGDFGEAMVGILGRESRDLIEIGGKLLTIREGKHVLWNHHRHRSNGVYYDPDCLVCRDN